MIIQKASVMLGAFATAASLAMTPSFADAHQRKYKHYHSTRAERCYTARKNSAATGAVIGTIGGALIGNSLSNGNRTPGTLLGAGAGAYVGHQIGKKNARCR